MVASQYIPKKSAFLFFAALALMGSTVAYGVFKSNELMKLKAAVKENESTIVKIQTESAVLEAKYTETIAAYQKEEQEYLNKIDTILPDDPGYTKVARLFDDFFAEHNRKASPIEQNNLIFGQIETVKDMNHVSFLPVSMNLSASRENLLKFLDFIENSGSLEKSVRLMEITGINFNFPENGELIEDPQQEVNFDVRMKLYFRTPRVSVT